MKILSFAFLLALVMLTSCKPKSASFCIVPESTFVDMLIDVHIADGYYGTRFDKYKAHTQKENFYNDIFKKYGYSRACFDSTYVYYTRHPQEFDVIYEKIVTELSKAQQDVYKFQAFDQDTTYNLYKKKRNWDLPLNGRTNKIPFDIKLKKSDTALYTVMAQIRFLDHDKCKNPKMVAYFWYKDGSKDGHHEYFPETPYRKSRRYKFYSTSLKLTDKKVTHIRGYIVDSDDKEGFRHLEVRKIVVHNDK